MSADRQMLRAAQRCAAEFRKRKKPTCWGGVTSQYLVELDNELRRLRRLVRKRIEHELVAQHCGLDAAVSIASWHELMRAVGRVPRCRYCGCTDARACPGGCSWVSVDICSTCNDAHGEVTPWSMVRAFERGLK